MHPATRPRNCPIGDRPEAASTGGTGRSATRSASFRVRASSSPDCRRLSMITCTVWSEKTTASKTEEELEGVEAGAHHGDHGEEDDLAVLAG